VRETNTQLQHEIERAPEFVTSEFPETEGGKPPSSWANVWLVWENRQFITRCGMVGAMISLILAFALPKEYLATTQLMPPDNEGLSALSMMASKVTSLSENPMIGKVAGDMLGAKTTGALFIGVLRSRTVEDRIIDKFDLRGVYWVRYYDSARKKLYEKTTIEEEKKSGIITITVADRDPQRAAAIAQEYVSQLNVLMAQLTTSRAHRERVFLEDRLRVAKGELDSASRDLGEFSSKNATLDLKDEGKAIVEAAATLQGELIVAQSEVKALEQIYSSNNVRVRSLHARIAELEGKLNEIGGTKGITTGSVDSSEVTPEQGQNFLYPSLRQLPVLGVRYGDLYLRAKIAERVYELLTAQFEMSRVEEAKEIPTVRALDVAIPPERKSWPPRTLILISGTLLFIVGGIFWILGKREWENVDSTDPRKIFVLEVHAVAAHRLASSRVVSYVRRRMFSFPAKD
jgi:capsule polysaccharide export protein KpsE/RkpR